MATCTRLRHRGCLRCHRCFRELGAADRMGGRCRDCSALVRRAGLAMAAFAGAGPRGDTGRRSSSILAAGGRSNCCFRHASAEHWTALMRCVRFWHKADIQLSLSNVRFFVRAHALAFGGAGEAEWGLLWVRIPLWESNCRSRENAADSAVRRTVKHFQALG